MNVNGKPYRTIWTSPDRHAFEIIDQTCLPHQFTTIRVGSFKEAVYAISSMQVRGAPLIGATAAYAMWLSAQENSTLEALRLAGDELIRSRPTAVNLRWAVNELLNRLTSISMTERPGRALEFAEEVCESDVESCRRIGLAGLKVIKALPEFKKNKRPINVLTHCNAGWLACVDWGSALSPIYAAHAEGIDIHVWVDETRPRNQGASLTSFELNQQGIPFHLISDNAGGHLMQEGKVDLCLVGADRVTRNGHVANKIGTYLKALAAGDNEVPFYVAFPGTTIDWSIDTWRDIPIEERSGDEVTLIRGRLQDGTIADVSIGPNNVSTANPAFDVTPSNLISGLITERGVAKANEDSLAKLYPEHSQLIQ